jgi:hypothetical protein
MRRLWDRAGPAVAGVVAGVVVAACGTASARTAVTGTTAPKTQPYDLYTHCGIDEARIGNGYFEANPPLSDGSGNPPAGWGNPYQAGTMTLVSATKAVFADKSGHRVVFRLRPGATTFLHLCS